MTRVRLQGIIAGVTFVAAIAMSAMAQDGAAAAQTATATQTAAPAETVAGAGTTYADSNETREALQTVLGKYPPQVSKVLKLDPSLFGNATYLANYPELAEFVAQHPEVAHSPAFFLEQVWLPTDSAPESATERLWRDTMQGLAIFMVMFLATGTLVWLIRTLIEHRRWSRLTRTQAEVHGKLMDRFASNEELLAYMQTPGGKRFLESSPIMVDAGPRAVSAPIGRMLGSVQIGLILAAGGIGLQYVSRSIDKTVSQPLLAIGVLAVAIGVGFLLSAVVSFVLSKRLGLIDAAAASRTAADAASATD
jgi:hypothetical protein